MQSNDTGTIHPNLPPEHMDAVETAGDLPVPKLAARLSFRVMFRKTSAILATRYAQLAAGGVEQATTALGGNLPWLRIRSWG